MAALGALVVIAAFAGQLLLGDLCFAVAAAIGFRHDRRRRAIWARATRELGRGRAWAFAVLAAASLAAYSLGGLGALALASAAWVSPWRLSIPGAIATACCYLVLDAGRLERRGRLRAARRQVRLAGLLLFPAILTLFVLVWYDLLFRPPFRNALLRGSAPEAPVLLLIAWVALGVAAFIGALAGLSGKPRPSGTFAVLFYVAGVLALAGASCLARPT